MMSKNRKANTLDYTNSLSQAFNEQEKAFNMINASSLVPARYGKILLEYFTSGSGIGQVSTATYLSEGVYQETRVICRGNTLGSAHKTTLSFLNRTAASLAGKAFVVYDDVGPVSIWFNVDGANVNPAPVGTYRNIVVPLTASDSSTSMATKTYTAVNADSSFIAISSSYFIIISSSIAGVKNDSYDFNTSLYLKNTAGTSSKTLNSTYFLISSANDLVSYYVWYNVGGTGIDPSLSGKTGIMVPISSTSNAYQVAAATKVVLDTSGLFLTELTDDSIKISNLLVGPSTTSDTGTSDFVVFTTIAGLAREVVGVLSLGYDNLGCLVSVERV
jgi:hypothetical protein